MNHAKIYRAEKGQTAADIAWAAGIPETLLLAHNRIGGVAEGDLLVIPEVRGRVYTVKPFETAESIAADFGITAGELLRKNGIERIYPFMDIIV